MTFPEHSNVIESVSQERQSSYFSFIHCSCGNPRLYTDVNGLLGHTLGQIDINGVCYQNYFTLLLTLAS